MKLAPLLAVTAVVGACAGSDARDGGPAITVEDSAGVQLVHSAGADAPLTLREELRIGAVDGPEHLQFYRIFDVILDNDGRIYVANAGSGEVRIFEGDGSYVRSIGRPGQGPGEFEFLSRLYLAGDTLFAFDATAHRITGFDTAGALIGTVPTRYGDLQLSPLGRSARGWVVGLSDYGRAWPYQVGVAFVDTLRIALVDDLAAAGTSEGGPQPTVRVPRAPTYGIQAPGTMTANSPLWHPQPAYAVDGLGQLHIGRGASYSIETWEANSADARLTRRLTREHTPVPVTATLIDAYFDEATTYYDTVSNRGHEFEIGHAAQTGHRALPHASSLPATGRIRAGPEGALWIERPDLVEDPVALEWMRAAPQATRWDIFDADGRYIGRTELPPGFRIYAVMSSSVIGVLRDELDVEHIVRWVVNNN